MATKNINGIEITDELVKSVRFCCGYTTDLRVKINAGHSAPSCYENGIAVFLLNNIYGVFGAYIFDKLGIKENPIPGRDTSDYAVLLDFVEKVATYICLR